MDPHSSSKMDPDPHSPKKLDPDPHKVNADPKHCMSVSMLVVLLTFCWPTSELIEQKKRMFRRTFQITGGKKHGKFCDQLVAAF
jgi:hypothetical protein